MTHPSGGILLASLEAGESFLLLTKLSQAIKYQRKYTKEVLRKHLSASHNHPMFH